MNYSKEYEFAKKKAVEHLLVDAAEGTGIPLGDFAANLAILAGVGKDASWWTIQESLDAYARDGRPTGGFLEAVLCNDLKEALGRADDINRQAIFGIVAYIRNEMPARCQGSPEKVAAWIKLHADRREQRAVQDNWTPGATVAYVPGCGDIEVGEFKGWGNRDGMLDRGFAFVLYHLGDTAAATDWEDLHEPGSPHVKRLLEAGRKLSDRRQLLGANTQEV